MQLIFTFTVHTMPLIMRFLKAIVLITILLSASSVSSQETNLLTKADWNILLPAINTGKWDDAEKISLEILNRFKGKNEMSGEAGIIRYMYIRCIAAQIGEKVYEKEEGLKKLKGFEGKNIVTPPIMFKANGIFNYLSLPKEGEVTVWRHCCTNNDATVIYTLEAYEPKDLNLIKESGKYEGKYLRLGAIIKEINAGGSEMPRLEIIYNEMFIGEVLNK